MRIVIPSNNYEIFVYQLLKNLHQAQSCFKFLISSQIMIKNEYLRSILILHSQQKYSQCYSQMINSDNSEFNFYSKLAILLLTWEEFQLSSFITTLNEDYNCSPNSKINFYKIPHREQMYINFNINYHTTIKYDNEEMIINDILNLMEYYKYIDTNYHDSSYLNLILYNFLNNGLVEEGENANYRSIKKFFEDNQILIENNEVIEKTYKVYNNNSISFSHVRNSFENSKNNEDDDLVDKLNYIYESINEINLDVNHPVNFQTKIQKVDLKNNESNEIMYKNKHNDKDTFYSESDDFLLKLKTFQILKKYYLKRKSKRSYLSKKGNLIRIAENFYINLLKSRVMYGLELMIRRKTNYDLLKNNFIDLRINELSQFLIDKMRYISNIKRKENYIKYQLLIKKEQKIFEVLKNKMNYKKNYNKFLLSQIMNNQYALDFTLSLCDKGRKYLIKKHSFEKIYGDLLTRKALNQNKKNFQNIFEILKKNLEMMKIKQIKVESIIQFIHQHNYFRLIKLNLYYKEKKAFYLQKLFFMRYYMYFYKKQSTRQQFNDKKEIVKKQILIKNNFLRLKHNVQMKINHHKKIGDIINSKKIQRVDNKRKLKITYNRYDNSENRKANAIEIYNYKLKQKAFLIMLNFHKIKNKISKFRNRIVHKEIELFLKKAKLKTIKSLIVQGIKEKIKNYQKILLFQVLFYSSFSKMKLEKGVENREKHLKRKGINFLRENVQINYKFIKLNLKFYFAYLKKLINFKKNYLTRQKNYQNLLEKKFYYYVFVKKTFLKQFQKLQTIDLINKFRKRSIEETAKLFLKKKKNKKNHLFSSKKRKIYGKMYIKKIVSIVKQKHKIGNYYSIFKIKLWNRFIRNINGSIITKSLKTARNQMLARNAYISFFEKFDSSSLEKENEKKLRDLAKQYYTTKLFDCLLISSKTKSLMDKIEVFHRIKLKKKIFHEYRKRYYDKIKFSFLAGRFNQYLIISSFNKFYLKMKKGNKSTN